ncbi:MAG: hypothetical protein KGL39_04690 [Patescibacteria group bacterium]|nr:hypothetical protein [Patescibacteria group bacterium]
MKEPVDHIIRPLLPWRTTGGAITECGYDASKVPSITREQYLDRCKELGNRRTAMLTCMTCADTCRRHTTWDEDPRRAVRREIDWECGGWYGNKDRNGQRLREELLAIAALIERHREEFEAEIEATRRKKEWNEKKAEFLAQQPQGRA